MKYALSQVTPHSRLERFIAIGELAELFGLRTSALRFYEQRGLLIPAGRVSGRRRYRPDAVERLRFLRFAQRLGFTLDEIHELLKHRGGRKGKERWRELVDAKTRQLDETIARARAMKRILAASRDCDCISLDSCRHIARFEAEQARSPRASSGSHPGSDGKMARQPRGHDRRHVDLPAGSASADG